MKTYCKGLRITHELVLEAYEEWVRAQSGKKNNWRLIKEYGTPELLSEEIVYEVEQRNLTFKPITYHNEYERNGKLRRIGQESVKQQIVDYVLICALKELYEDKIGFYQVSSIKGKGPIFGAKRIQKWVAEEDLLYVHADIRKCYESFDKRLVYDTYAKYVRSKDLLYIIQTLLDTYEKGLGIGSAFSLKSCQFLLSFVYHELEYISRTRRSVRVRCVKHQIWYADDFYLFGTDSTRLKIAMRKAESELRKRYALEVKPWKISHTNSEPVDFAGYVVTKNKVTIRDTTYLRIRRTYSRYEKKPSVTRARSVCSYWGNLKHTNSHRTVRVHGYDKIFRDAKHRISVYEKNNK